MIHHVFANKSNIGDWLSARGIQALLSLEVTEHLCDAPFVEETLARLSAASPDDAIIIGGGGLFMDYFTPFWEGFRPLAGKVPLFIWGVGYCDSKRHTTRPSAALLQEIVKKSRLCVVRDELSQHYLQSCALPPPVACPSIAAVEPAAKEGFGLLHVDNYVSAGPGVYEAMDRLCREFAERTGRDYRQTNNRIEPERENELQAALTRYRKSDLVVSSALHGCVLGLALGKKVLAVAGDRKIDSFMASAGLADWVCGPENLDRLPGLLEALHEQPAPKAFLERALTENREIARQVRKLIQTPK